MLGLEVMEVLKSGHLLNGAGGSLKGVSCQREHLQTQLTIMHNFETEGTDTF